MTDQEIQTCMEELYQKQQKCLRVQKRLAIAATVFFLFAFVPLLASMLIGIFWANPMANKATALARQRYPYVTIGSDYGGRGFSYDPKLIAEANYFHDDITVKILKFNRSSINYILRGILGCVLMWFFVAILKEFGINLYPIIGTIFP